MKAIRLLKTTMIAGLPRSPAEGIQTVAPDEAKRLIALGMAMDADFEIDLADEHDDGLEAKNVKTLRKLAKDEGADVEGDANKDAVIAAIRAKRAADAAASSPGSDDDLDGKDEAALREIATAEEVEIAADTSVEDIVAAIRAKREQA